MNRARWSTWWRGVLVATAVVVIPSAPAFATPGVPDPPPPVVPDPPHPSVPAPQPEVVSDPGSLIQAPAGCRVPAPADVAFVGTVLAKDEFVQKGTVRYRIDQLRAGDASPFSVDGVIDVRYGPDSQYLDVDSQYLVSAAVDPRIAVLGSKVSPETLLFGGDAVVGLDDTEIDCPVIDDPVMTLNLDGTPIDSGLFTPLFEDRKLLLATIGVPAAIVALALVGLVLLRRAMDVGFRGIFTLARAAVTPSRDHRAARVRHHRSEMDAGDEDVDDLTDDELVDA
ncbi:MAG: hypothetical protein ABJ314_10750 [Ilumatobacter sp.]|uniref:hypothetical protein n=1 Tax=Ilumatobacter sp. TaxID=1967498 RepID=UPI00329800CB